MQNFIDAIADIKGNQYVSKIDGSYISLVEMPELFIALKQYGITEQVQNGTGGGTANIGFNPEEQKWYGWSHRAIYGFGIGSECKKGQCHYRGSTEEEQKEAAILFWQDTYKKNVRCEGIIEKESGRWFDIKWEYTSDVPNEELQGAIGGCEHFIEPLGKGEWVAETLEDAKQMACDFAEGVS